MSLYRVVVCVPTLSDDLYGTLAAQLRRGNAESSPVLVEIDEEGGLRVLRGEGEQRPRSSRIGVSLSVDAPDQLQAATTSIALFALTMDAAGLRDHYPTVVQLTPAEV